MSILDTLKQKLKEDKKISFYVRVKPGAKQTRLVPTKDMIGGFFVDIKAPAKEGKANFELIKFLAEVFSVPKSYIYIKVGQKSRLKLVKINGIRDKR